MLLNSWVWNGHCTNEDDIRVAIRPSQGRHENDMVGNRLVENDDSDSIEERLSVFVV
jgi:hypothetical protein